MSIRLAENADLPAILKIYNQAVRAGQCTAHTSPLTLEDMSAWFAEHSAEKYPVYVYVYGEPHAQTVEVEAAAWGD